MSSVDGHDSHALRNCEHRRLFVLADFNAADRMIGNARNIADFIQAVDTAAKPVAQKEFAMLLAEKQKVRRARKRFLITRIIRCGSRCGGRSSISIRLLCGRICRISA